MKKINILVNYAGIHNEKNLDFINITEKEYDDVLNTNLKGTFFISQAITKYFIKEKIKGNILFISSNGGSEPAWSPYSVLK